MKRFLSFFAAMLIVSCISLHAGGFRIRDYYDASTFLPASAGILGAGPNGFFNPAALTYLNNPDISYTWTDSNQYTGDSNTCIYLGFPNFGFGRSYVRSPLGDIYDYKIGFAGGNKGFNMGFGYGWSEGDTGQYNRTNVYIISALMRPGRRLSLGVTGNITSDYKETQAVYDLGFRPFGNEKATLFGDYTVQKNDAPKEEGWSAGICLEPLDGLRLIARYFKEEKFTAGVQLSFGPAGITTQGVYDKSQNHKYNVYSARFGFYDRNSVDSRNKFVKLELNGGLSYQRRGIFDKSRTLTELLSLIEQAKQDAHVKGIAINASGMRYNHEMMWEIREKLKDFKTAGKKVVVYIDNADIVGYYFASVADKVAMNPLGMLELHGIAFNTFYLKNTMDKLGIGFEELRYFKYKSAVEVFSRTNMSDGEKEQLRKVVDNFYGAIKADVLEARKISPEQFDRIVNDGLILTPEQAIENKLVDTLDVWESTWIAAGLTKKQPEIVPSEYLEFARLSKDNMWGPEPKIAVIYAIGICAVDSGINARQLVKDIEGVANDPMVKAVVLRVDSPGGSAVASDMVANAVLKCKMKKPVVVSQGGVAASGGYWISMYGEPIITSPATITGSIGVISGWVYNKGFKEKLGISTDFVSIGKHADLFVGMPLPFVGVLPDRNINDAERDRMKSGMLSAYDKFVQRVSSGRKKPRESVETVAQGRIWSGADAVANGLADQIGGMEKAISEAKRLSGIAQWREVSLVELPKRKTLDFGPLFSGVFSKTYAEPDALVEHIRFRLDHNGEALAIIPADFIALQDSRGK